MKLKPQKVFTLELHIGLAAYRAGFACPMDGFMIRDDKFWAIHSLHRFLALRQAGELCRPFIAVGPAEISSPCSYLVATIDKNMLVLWPPSNWNHLPFGFYP